MFGERFWIEEDVETDGGVGSGIVWEVILKSDYREDVASRGEDKEGCRGQ